MWRKVVVGVVGVAVVGSAIVLAQGLQPGPRDPGPGRQQPGAGGQPLNRRQIQRAVMNAPRAMAAHNGKVYMIKQGMLLQLDQRLNIENSVRVPREVMIRPQLTADTNRVYLSGVRRLMVFGASNLREVDSKPLNEISPLQQDEPGRVPGQQPERGGTVPAPREGSGTRRRSPERREGVRPSPEAGEGDRRSPEERR